MKATRSETEPSGRCIIDRRARQRTQSWHAMKIQGRRDTHRFDNLTSHFRFKKQIAPRERPREWNN